MSVQRGLKRTRRIGRSVAFLVLLLGAIGFVHWLAIFRMDMADRRFFLMDDRTTREMLYVDFIQANLWIAGAYAAISVASVAWLEVRAAPRWSVWAAFIAFVLPLLAYTHACLHVGSKIIMWF